MEDPVQCPRHYTLGAIECIDAIESALTRAEFSGYLKGAAMKYIWRAGHKTPDWVQDIRKAIWYLEHLIATG